jgi:hypothetical protein
MNKFYETIFNHPKNDSFIFAPVCSDFWRRPFVLCMVVPEKKVDKSHPILFAQCAHYFFYSIHLGPFSGSNKGYEPDSRFWFRIHSFSWKFDFWNSFQFDSSDIV